MGEFTPIETQEAFDAAIKDRLNRQSEKHKAEIAKYADYEEVKANLAAYEAQAKSYNDNVETLNKDIEAFKTQIAEKDGIIKGYETKALKSKIAAEIGLSNDAINFLNGDTEDDIRTSAEALKKVVGVRVDSPLASSALLGKSDSRESALYQLVGKLNL